MEDRSVRDRAWTIVGWTGSWTIFVGFTGWLLDDRFSVVCIIVGVLLLIAFVLRTMYEIFTEK